MTPVTQPKAEKPKPAPAKKTGKPTGKKAVKTTENGYQTVAAA